jgi:hypothetical protein
VVEIFLLGLMNHPRALALILLVVFGAVLLQIGLLVTPALLLLGVDIGVSLRASMSRKG